MSFLMEFFRSIRLKKLVPKEITIPLLNWVNLEEQNKTVKISNSLHLIIKKRY